MNEIFKLNVCLNANEVILRKTCFPFYEIEYKNCVYI